MSALDTPTTYRASLRCDAGGLDTRRQRYHAGMFIQSDALAYLAEAGTDGFVAVHASPPCQFYSPATAVGGRRSEHPDLVGPTRDALEATGLPWIIENVEGAPLRNPVLVCGAALGLRHDGYVLKRHRIFESNVALVGTGCGCQPADKVIGVYGGGNRTHTPRADGGGGDTRRASRDEARVLMGMPWASKKEMNQAIPPAYTEFLGAQLAAAIARAAAPASLSA